MLAEIFFLRLEAALRTTKEATQAGNAQFISEAPSIVPAAAEKDSKHLMTSPDVGVSCGVALSHADEVIQ